MGLSDPAAAPGLPARPQAQLMAESDYVVVATPHTPSTHELVNAAAIAAMRPNAVLVNVGRGKCIEEPALIAGGLRCAAPAGLLAPCAGLRATCCGVRQDRGSSSSGSSSSSSC
jgi:hypothetical protein